MCTAPASTSVCAIVHRLTGLVTGGTTPTTTMPATTAAATATAATALATARLALGIGIERGRRVIHVIITCGALAGATCLHYICTGGSVRLEAVNLFGLQLSLHRVLIHIIHGGQSACMHV
jgi:hypothetical protein